MKVIDLLNKIANGEEVPKLIRYSNTTFKYSFMFTNYLNVEDVYDVLFDDIVTHFLNDEIEIIEEPKKIEKISLEIDKFEDSYYDTALIKIAGKLDEIIDYINEGE